MSQRRFLGSRIVFALFCALFGFAAQAEQPPIAVKGVLDLRNWDFATQGSIEMQGEWAFYWKKFYDGDHFRLGKDIQPDAYLSVPNAWNGLALADGKVANGPGFATLRLKIRLPQSISISQVKFLRIVVRPIDSPYEMQVFDSSGKPLSELVHSGDLNQKLVIPPKHAQSSPVLSDSELIVIWRISNHQRHAVAGPWRVPELGKEAVIVSKLKINRSIDFLLIGIALTAGFYHWVLFLLRPRDYEAFWFGLFCLCIAFVVFYVNEYIGDFLGEDLNYDNLQKLLVLLVNLDIISLVYFLRSIIPQHAKGKFSIALATPSVFCIVMVWILPFQRVHVWIFHILLTPSSRFNHTMGKLRQPERFYERGWRH
ncbi:MAG: 7TM diverse intracellular signaling domain-containing protein [Candidatus Competibacteraceae bacterium]